MPFFAALLFASVLAGDAPSGSVEGTWKGSHLGANVYCTGVYLIPRSPDIDNRIAQKFGNLSNGIAQRETALTAGARSKRLQPPAGGRKARCQGRFSKTFQFSEVAPGEYYVTMTASAPVAQDMELFTVELMQRVTVAPAQTAKVDFKHIG